MILRNWILAMLLILFVLLSFFFFFKEDEIPEMKSSQALDPCMVVEEALRCDTVIFEGMVVYSRQTSVSFPLSGVLEEGIRKFNVGDRFAKGEILYQLNNSEAFALLRAKKIDFALSVKNLIAQIPTALSSEKEKWLTFANSIKTDDLLPELPEFKSNAERLFFENSSFPEAYQSVFALENQLRNYYYAAPFDGVFTEIHLRPGAKVASGKSIGQIARLTEKEIKTNIKTGFFDWQDKKPQALVFVNERGEKFPARFDRMQPLNALSSSSQSQTAFYHGSKTPQAGSKLSAHYQICSDQPLCALPQGAYSENKVSAIQQGKYIQKTIRIESRTADSVYVSGLKSGDSVLLQFHPDGLNQ